MGRTKGSSQGSIFKQGKLWRGQIILNNERKSVSGKTKKEVADKLAKLRVDYNNGVYAERSDITVKEWSELWMSSKLRSFVTEQTYIRVEALFRNHVNQYIGDMKMQMITGSDIESLYKKICTSKGNYDKNYKNQEYSRSTIAALHAYVKKCFDYAVDCKVLASNPAKNITLPRFKPPKKVSSYTCTDQEKIINICKYSEHVNYRIFYFLIGTGMRFGEAAALTWNDIDLKTGQINITKTAVSIHGSMVIQDHTKTESGTRTIFVGDNIRTWLEWHKSTLNVEHNTKDLVFPNRKYNVIIISNARRSWIKIQKEADISYQGMHALRHTWATRALEEGVNIKVVSQILGHKNITTTMNIYQDVLDTEKQKVASVLNNLF